MNKKIKYITFGLLSFLVLMNTTMATCEEDLNHLRTIQSKFKVTYELNQDETSYIVKMYNPEPDRYYYETITFNSNSSSVSKEIVDNETILTNVNPGLYTYAISSVGNSCNMRLKEIDIKVPPIYKFYKDPLCTGNEEFILCQKNYDKEITYETFVSRMNSYMKEKKEKEQINQDNIKKINPIIRLIKENIVSIIAISVLVIVLLVIVILGAKKYIKRRRLE